MEAYEGADWVRISDEVPIDEDGPRRRPGDASRRTTTPARRGSVSETALDRATTSRRRRGRPGPRPRGLTRRGRRGRHERLFDRHARRGARLDGAVPPASARCGSSPSPPAPSRSAFTWRSMPPGTGGKGSYGHRHATRRRSTSSISGSARSSSSATRWSRSAPAPAVRVAADIFRSVHNVERRRGRDGDLSRSGPTTTESETETDDRTSGRTLSEPRQSTAT